MKCRKDIKGRKTWVDADNLYLTRPNTVEIVLYRDGEIYKTATLNSGGDGTYKFPCLIIWKNQSEQYNYRVDEINVPNGYTKTIQGFNVINTLENITINGVKTWADNNNEQGSRPTEITVRLLQNGVEIDSLQVASPPDAEETAEIDFGERPYADVQGIPYSYTLTEDSVQDYETRIEGLQITNTYQVPVPFSFVKTDSHTPMTLAGATFEILKNGVVQSTAVSDANGVVSFNIHGTGNFQLQETQPPAGYMDNTTVYQINVAADGKITVDGKPASEFNIKNELKPYGLTLQRATGTIPVYTSAPNTWALHGTTGPVLYMTDKILIAPEVPPVTVKWEYGTKDISYFKTGGTDMTGTYTDGLFVETNGAYTVYARFGNGSEVIKTIAVNNIRDGSAAMPYLLLDYITAANLESTIKGINKFTIEFMQGGGEKLNKNYELYENINMAGKEWEPLGSEDRLEGFTGSLYGNGHDIKNLDIGGFDFVWNQGFFRVLSDGAVVQNLGIIDADIKSTYNSGALTAYITISNGGTVLLKDLRMTGSVTNIGYAAGIVGVAEVSNGSLIVENCTADATVKAENGAGIIASGSVREEGSLSIKNCYASGSITADSSAGILVLCDNSSNLNIDSCVNAMSFINSTEAGGIVAILNGSDSGKTLISSCYNKENITAVKSAGGILGECYNEDITDIKIENCYNSGAITSTQEYSFAGGILGKLRGFCTIQNSYNIGSIILSNPLASAEILIGGISGNYGSIQNCASIGALLSSSNLSLARISPSSNLSSNFELNNNVAFNNMQVLISGTQKSPLDTGSSGKDGIDTSAAVIKTQALYQNSLGWDFTNVWSFGNSGYTLPVLKSIPLSLQPVTLPVHLS